LLDHALDDGVSIIRQQVGDPDEPAVIRVLGEDLQRRVVMRQRSPVADQTSRRAPSSTSTLSSRTTAQTFAGLTSTTISSRIDAMRGSFLGGEPLQTTTGKKKRG
jgi:hypothetical protein